MKKEWRYLSLSLALAISACGGAEEQIDKIQNAINGTATPQPTSVSGTSTPTPTALANATATPVSSSPTATAISTSTSSSSSSAATTPTATKTSTATPATTTTATATKTATATTTTAPTATKTATPTSTATPTATPTSTTSSGISYRGVSLAIAEFGAGVWGDGTLPGTYGSTYTYPTTSEVDYFVGKGMNTLRLPFRWERVQQTLGGNLDSAEIARIDSFVSYATGKGAYVVLDPHNYARYNGNNVIGASGSSVTIAHFSDFWSRMASRYKSNSKVIFALMNEPHDMDTTIWVNAANTAITAIRATGASNLILVPGNSWTGAHSWVSSGNSTAMLGIADSGNNYAFEVHQYLDSDSSGTSETCVSSTIGSERLVAFTNWLKTNGKKGFLGELGGARNATCYAAVDDQLTYVDNNSSVWIGWTWWAAGPWWGDYMFTLEPSGSTDRPQMAYLLKHIPSSASGKKKR